MATKTNLFASNVPASEWDGSSAFVSTISVTVPSGAGALSLRISGDDTAPASVTLKASSDQALTQTLFTTDNDSQGIGFYTLTSPEAGTFDLEINTGGAQRTYYGIVDSIADTSGVGDSDSGTAYTTGSTLTLTTTVGDLVLDIINAGASATSGADQTDDITPSGRTHASSLVADDTSEAMSWTLASQRWVHAAVVFTSSESGPSITPSDPVVDGAEATITTSGLSGAITATLGGYSLTTAGTLPNLTYTTDIASITANGPVSVPRIGESLTLSVTGDEGEATSTVDFDPAAGYAAITLAGTLANETDSLIDGMQTASGLTVAVGDIMYYPTADTTSIAATGALTTDSESLILILIQGGSATTAGNAYAFTVTPEAVTNVVNSARPRSFSVSNLRIGL